MIRDGHELKSGNLLNTITLFIMKKALSAVLLTLSALGAHAQSTGAYIGTDLFSNRLSGVGTTGGLGVFAGYRFGNGFAVEASANRIGRYEFDFGTISVNDFSVSGLYSMPVNDTVSIYGRVGVGSLRVSDKNSLASKGVKLDNGLTFGAGASLKLTPKIEVRAELRKPASDVTSVGVGVSYHF